MVDTEIPADVQLTCIEDSHCPVDWICISLQGLCAAPGSALTVDMEALKTEVCQAMHEKGEECPSEIEATLGDELTALFEMEEYEFIALCKTEFLGQSTEEDAADLNQAKLLPLAPCDTFVEAICGFLPSDGGYETRCP